MESAVLRTALFIYLDTANICDKLMNDNKNMVTKKTVSFLPTSPVTQNENLPTRYLIKLTKKVIQLGARFRFNGLQC